MTSTPRRLALTSLAVPLLTVLACTDPPATTDGESDSDSGSTGEATDGPSPTTTEDPSGEPTEHHQRYFLHVDDTPPPPLPAIELNKEKTLEVFGEAAARDIHLIDVDSGPLIDEVLNRILYACGDKWDDYYQIPCQSTADCKDAPDHFCGQFGWCVYPNEKLPADPKHDCSLTELGQSFGNTETERKATPQFQMVRLLSMTPRNARVEGTVLNDLAVLFAPENNFFGTSFQDLLAASLFCPLGNESASECAERLKSTSATEVQQEAMLHTRPFIDAKVLAATLRDTLLASHPGVQIKDGKALLGVSLYDALKDMQPLSIKYGPDMQSGHPGILKPDDADFTTASDALTPEFKMVAFADSNLRRVEGIDASVGAGELYVNALADADNPMPAPLTFNFEDANKVRIEGITANPTVDMRMQLFEIDGGAEPGTLAPVPPCDGTHGTDNDACKQNLPGDPILDQFIWSQKPWTLEYIIAHAAYSSFMNRAFFHCFKMGPNSCLAGAAIGTPDPMGWTTFIVGVPDLTIPPPQYFWELLLDVGQESLHDFLDPMKKVSMDGKGADGTPEIAEGQLNPTFTLRKLPIGLTAEELEAALRPNLQAQGDKLANTVLGRYWKNNARLDFYYRRGNDIDAGGGAPMLFFVAESDLRPPLNDPNPVAPSNYGYDPEKIGFYTDAGLTQKVSSKTVPGSDDTDHEKYQLPVGQTVLYIQDDEQDTYRLEFLVPEGADPTEIVVRVDPA